MSQADLIPKAEPPPEPRRAEYDVDYTPRAIPRQVFEELAPELGDVRRILIPAAGAGSWAAEARARWPDAHITAVEIRPEEKGRIERWCDEIFIGDVRAWDRPSLEHVPLRQSGPSAHRFCRHCDRHENGWGEPCPRLQYDLIADNPRFSMAPKDGGRKSQAETLRAYVVNLRPLLNPGGRLCLLHLSDLGQRSKEARAILEEHMPIYQMRHQPLRYRATGGTDLRSYSTWVWGSKHNWPLRPGVQQRWLTWDMPALEASQRRWSVVPGSEDK